MGSEFLAKSLWFRRKPLETFVQHIQRATRKLITYSTYHGYIPLTSRVLKSIFDLGGSIGKYRFGSEGIHDSKQLMSAMIQWCSSIQCKTLELLCLKDCPADPSWRRRRLGRPIIEWEDILVKCFGLGWLSLAGDACWMNLWERVRNFVYTQADTVAPEIRYPRKDKQLTTSSPLKTVRLDPPQPLIEWSFQANCLTVALAGDNETVIGMQIRSCGPKQDLYQTAVASSMRILHHVLPYGAVRPPAVWHDSRVHISREHNAAADE